MDSNQEIKDFLKIKDLYCVMRIVHKETGKKVYYVSKDLESTTTPKYFTSVEHAFYIKSLIKSRTEKNSEYKVVKLKAQITKIDYSFKEKNQKSNQENKERVLTLIK